MTDPTKIITWLASYPKSGNTWVRFMLLNLTLGPQNTTERMQAVIPDIHKCRGEIRLSAGIPILMKTHFMLTREMSLLEYTEKFVYIVRNPMDVMMSNLNYNYTRLGIEKGTAAGRKLEEEYVEEFIEHEGDPNWARFGFGSWNEHVTSWVRNENGLRGLLVRYEDLLAKPADQLLRIARFLAMPRSPDEIETAVRCSTFDRMKFIEEQELANRSPGFFTGENQDESIRKGNRFMNRGRVGEGAKLLAPEQRDRFLDKFGSVMELVGYRVHR